MPVGDRWTPQFSARSGTHVAWTRHGHGTAAGITTLALTSSPKPTCDATARSAPWLTWGARSASVRGRPSLSAVIVTQVQLIYAQGSRGGRFVRSAVICIASPCVSAKNLG